MTEIKKIPGHYYTTEELDFIKQNCFGRTTSELTKLFNQHFCLNLTTSQITCKKKALKLKNGVVTRFEKGQKSYPRGVKYQNRFTVEQLEFLKNNIEKPNYILTDAFNSAFGTKLPMRKIISAKNRHGLNGVVHYGSKYITGFKKGHIPPKYRPVGSENVHGQAKYVWLKITSGKGMKNLIQKSRFVWEKANGPIPEGHKIIFLDGNNQNFDISNLAIVSCAELCRLNQLRLASKNPELTKTGIAIAKLKTKLGQILKKKEKNMSDRAECRYCGSYQTRCLENTNEMVHWCLLCERRFRV